jgi:hypothetical protein
LIVQRAIQLESLKEIVRISDVQSKKTLAAIAGTEARYGIIIPSCLVINRYDAGILRRLSFVRFAGR